jgi:hypothetical protein
MAETLILSLSSCPAGSYSVSTIELNGPISQLRHFRAYQDAGFSEVVEETQKVYDFLSEG